MGDMVEADIAQASETSQAPLQAGEAAVSVPQACLEKCGQLRGKIGELAITTLQHTSETRNLWINAVVCDARRKIGCGAMELYAIVNDNGTAISSDIDYPRSRFGLEGSPDQASLMRAAIQQNGKLNIQTAAKLSKKPRL